MTGDEAKEHFSDPMRRLENNHYALEKARERLRVAIESRDKKEAYAAIGELLLWVMTTEEWHWKHNKGFKRRRNRHEKGQILFGLRHAYNSMKHNMIFYQIHDTPVGFTFPFTFPVHFKPLNILWTAADEKLEEGYDTEIKNYKAYIEGKNVSFTFNEAIEFLYEEYERIK